MSTSLSQGVETSSFSSVIGPREDLFRHVNGPWIDTFRLPDDLPLFGSFYQLDEESQQNIRNILEDETTPCKLSRLLYQSFLDTSSIEAAGISPIRPLLNDIDTVQNKQELLQVLGKLSVLGITDVFNSEVYGDPGNPKFNALHIEQGGLALPDEAYYREDKYAPIREEYVKFIQRLLELAGYEAQSDTEKLAEEFLRVETALAKYHWTVVETRDSQKTYNPQTFAQLENVLQDFDIHTWLDSWQKTYNTSDAAKVEPIDIYQAFKNVIVHEPSFIAGLNTFWKEQSLQGLQLWARVHTLLHYSPYLSSTFDKAQFAFYGTVLSGTTEQRERWKRAVNFVNGASGEDVGREYVRRHFPPASAERMKKLIDNLLRAYQVSIEHSDWLGEDTKAKALDKLSKFSPKIGYTRSWRDYSALIVKPDNSLIENLHAIAYYADSHLFNKVGKPVDSDEWLMTPQTVNAYYESTQNIIVFPAAILQPPFFDINADDAANYGGIGCVIGHEIGHGFDDQGSQFDGDGKLNNWWTDEDRKQFTERTKLLIDQYNRCVPRQLRDKYEGTNKELPHVMGDLTIGENIGDLSGVNIALKAYAFALQQSTGKEIDGSDQAIRQTLLEAPVMDGMTALQRFFFSYAAIWRGKARNECAEQLLQIDPHSPGEFRTNVVVSNVDLFHEAFGVQPNDAMWLDPDQRVHIW